METTVNIRIIDNHNKRLDILRPLLDYLVSKKMGKNDNGLYIVRTSLISSPRTEEEHLFKALQEHSNRSGFMFNCYNFRDDKE